MLRIYDCSNSSERPPTRGFGGTVENVCVTMLKRYAAQFQAEFVDSPEAADVIFTNDMYPESILRLNKRRVKRMDGIYWQYDLAHRNQKLNAAAEQSDCVVFVSDFSRRSLKQLYGIRPKMSYVVLNAADEKIYNPSTAKHGDPMLWLADCTHWGRGEKRLEDTLHVAKALPDGAWLYLSGVIPESVRLPANVRRLGYIDSPSLWSDQLNEADVFVNLSYRDAAPKVVAEAVACGLPVLYADSGGTRELCGNQGVAIEDTEDTGFRNSTPRLNPQDIARGVQEMCQRYHALRLLPRLPDSGRRMLQGYFHAFNEVMS